MPLLGIRAGRRKSRACGFSGHIVYMKKTRPARALRVTKRSGGLMKYENGKATDLQIAYIGGGSRGWAWTFMTDLALEKELSGTIRLYDIDREAAIRNAVIGNRLTARPDVSGKWTYEVHDSLASALSGADFAVISILPGTFDEMESDVHLPERFDIWQSVGDTAGPGGIVRALRAIPMFVTIAEAIRDYAPEAWVINYTNPMSLLVKTLYRVFPGIKAFGCCHEVFGTQKVLAAAAEEVLGIPEVRREDVHVNVLGINHFTWFDQASYKGYDLFPVYEEFIRRHPNGYDEPERNWMNSTFNCAHLVKFDLFRRFGAIAAAGDRHLAEFMPGDDYLRDPDTVARWKFGLTPVSWRKEDLLMRLQRSERLYQGTEEFRLEPTGEEGILLIKALCGLTRVVSNVNIPNSGLPGRVAPSSGENGFQIPNLPASAIVETNAVFSRDSVRPLLAGPLSEALLPLVKVHTDAHERILDAALGCEFEPAFEAFMKDPLVTGRVNLEEGRVLLTEMIRNTRKFLPDGWKI